MVTKREKVKLTKIQEYNAKVAYYYVSKTKKEIQEDIEERYRAEERQRARDYWRDYDRREDGCVMM